MSLACTCLEQHLFFQSWQMASFTARHCTAVMGDVNENLGIVKIRPFNKKMKSLGFEQLINSPTCDTGTTLDHIYVNKAMKEKGITTELDAAYYSDHDIISLYIPN